MSDNSEAAFIYLGFIYKNLHEYKNAEGARVHIDGQTDDLCESVPQRGTILYEPL